MEELEAQQNPYDTTGDIQQLEAIHKELSDIEASIENDFAEHISEILDQDQVFEELFFSDRVTFFKKVLEEQNRYVEAILQPRMQKAQELSDSITQKNELGFLESIKQDFMQRNPDVDIQALIMFYMEDLPPRVQEEIQKAPKEQFFDIVYDIYQKSQPQPREEALPAQSEGVGVSSEQADIDHNMQMTRV